MSRRAMLFKRLFDWYLNVADQLPSLSCDDSRFIIRHYLLTRPSREETIPVTGASVMGSLVVIVLIPRTFRAHNPTSVRRAKAA